MSDTLNPYELANLADVASPDGADTPGARFLESIAQDVADYLENGYGGDRDDDAREIADQSVPAYTHELFLTLVDLAAYSETVDDFGTPKDIEQAAQWALYQVGRRLAVALFEQADELEDVAR